MTGGFRYRFGMNNPPKLRAAAERSKRQAAKRAPVAEAAAVVEEQPAAPTTFTARGLTAGMLLAVANLPG